MKQSRLSTALDEGLVLAGLLHVMRPPVGYDFASLESVSVSTTFRPDFEHFERLGLIGEGRNRAATLVVLPRSKTLARQMVSEAIQMGGLVLVDGQKTDGVESIYKDVRKVAAIEGVITKGHGRLFWFQGGAVPDWDVRISSPDGFVTVAGVFSEQKVDVGSGLLAPHLAGLKGAVCDLGAGWGYLSRAVLTSDAVTTLDMVEAEKLALECAVENVPDPRAHAIWADATTFSGGPYDAVVSNPPFHTGRAGDPDLGRAFISTARRILKPSGQFLMVANRHLPYEAVLNDGFQRVDELDGSGAFKLFRATRPKR